MKKSDGAPLRRILLRFAVWTSMVKRFPAFRSKTPKTRINTKKNWVTSFMSPNHGWAGGIRTHEVTESKSVALPLGDSPIFDTPRV